MSGAERRALLAIGGFEPRGRVGLLVDAEVARALGARVTLVATAVTAQGRRPRAQEVTASVLDAQLSSALEGAPLLGVKLGMIPSRRALAVVRRRLAALSDVPVVVDPVVRSSSGLRLSTLRPEDFLALAAPNVVLTPNADELAWLSRRPARRARLEAAEAIELGVRLARLGFRGVVVKGGHLEGRLQDLVCTAQGVVRLRGARVERSPERHRGTGCRFATALVLSLARGAELAEAARLASRTVRRFLRLC